MTRITYTGHTDEIEFYVGDSYDDLDDVRGWVTCRQGETVDVPDHVAVGYTSPGECRCFDGTIVEWTDLAKVPIDAEILSWPFSQAGKLDQPDEWQPAKSKPSPKGTTDEPAEPAEPKEDQP